MLARTAAEIRILRSLTPHTRTHALALLAAHPLLRMSSGLRTPIQNRRVGGVPTSFHLRGRAVDFVGPKWDLTRAAGTAWAQRVTPNCSGPEEVLLEDLDKPNQHLHVAW